MVLYTLIQKVLSLDPHHSAIGGIMKYRDTVLVGHSSPQNESDPPPEIPMEQSSFRTLLRIHERFLGSFEDVAILSES